MTSLKKTKGRLLIGSREPLSTFAGDPCSSRSIVAHAFHFSFQLLAGVAKVDGTANEGNLATNRPAVLVPFLELHCFSTSRLPSSTRKMLVRHSCAVSTKRHQRVHLPMGFCRMHSRRALSLDMCYLSSFALATPSLPSYLPHGLQRSCTSSDTRIQQ